LVCNSINVIGIKSLLYLIIFYHVLPITSRDSSVSFYCFKQGHRCNKCRYEKAANKTKNSYEIVKQLFINNNYKLLSDYYKNSSMKLQYVCPLGHVGYITYDDFKQGKRCKQCYVENNIGENHPNWNSNLTEKDRIKRRHLAENYEWRNKVFERDDYTCQVCGTKNITLNAHHLDGYHWAIDKRFNVNNGVTLCFNCHSQRVSGSFHSIYGVKNNNKEQFEEFLLFKNNQIQTNQETG
jgi:5-methylcytosine-specific restriction endonuclease McrA